MSLRSRSSLVVVIGILATIGMLLQGVYIVESPGPDGLAFELLVNLIYYAAITCAILWYQWQLGSFRLTNLSVWLPIFFFIEFGFFPLLAVWLDIEEADQALLTALRYAILGSACFAVGCAILGKKVPVSHFVYRDSKPSRTRLITISALFTISVCCKLYLLKAGLFAYTASAEVRDASVSYLQWITLPSNLDWFALVLISIETFRLDAKAVSKYVFGVIVAVSLFFAVLSGMKEDLLIIAMLIYAAWRCSRGPLSRRSSAWLAVGFVAFLIFLIPFNSYYRSELNDNGGARGVDNSAGLLQKAAGEALNESDASTIFEDGFETMVSRMDLLTTLQFLILDNGSSNIRTSEETWMIPLFAFVPRAIWKDKPILNMGQKLSIAMGVPETTSTAVTPLGDLYMIGGVAAIAIGMLVLGLGSQWCTNALRGVFDSRTLFLYIVMWRLMAKPEYDMFYFCSYVVQIMAIAWVVSHLVYGSATRLRNSESSLALAV